MTPAMAAASEVSSSPGRPRIMTSRSLMGAWDAKTRARILVGRGERPAARGQQTVSDDFRIHRCEGIMLVENQNAVVAVVFGDVRSGDPVLSANAPERVRGRSCLRVAERIVSRSLDRL